MLLFADFLKKNSTVGPLRICPKILEKKIENVYTKKFIFENVTEYFLQSFEEGTLLQLSPGTSPKALK